MKERHKKSFLEKYGNVNQSYPVKQFLDNVKRTTPDIELFEKIPYIGYLRIEIKSEFADWWYDSDDDWVQAKVINIDENMVEIIHYDSHHHQMVRRIVDSTGFYVEGNVLREGSYEDQTNAGDMRSS